MCPCHVPADVNSADGTAYSNLIQNQRLIEKDPSNVTVFDA